MLQPDMNFPVDGKTAAEPLSRRVAVSFVGEAL
jgi:hypothetical protein